MTSMLDADTRVFLGIQGNPLDFSGIDFHQILQSDQAAQIISSLPPQALYYGLKRQGIADSLDASVLERRPSH